eukprot:scaffold49567_cov63-Phaeocystis_antarctica.AAC.3
MALGFVGPAAGAGLSGGGILTSGRANGAASGSRRRFGSRQLLPRPKVGLRDGPLRCLSVCEAEGILSGCINVCLIRLNSNWLLNSVRWRWPRHPRARGRLTDAHAAEDPVGVRIGLPHCRASHRADLVVLRAAVRVRVAAWHQQQAGQCTAARAAGSGAAGAAGRHRHTAGAVHDAARRPHGSARAQEQVAIRLAPRLRHVGVDRAAESVGLGRPMEQGGAPVGALRGGLHRGPRRALAALGGRRRHLRRHELHDAATTVRGRRH